jgi:hypothetical protein
MNILGYHNKILLAIKCYIYTCRCLSKNLALSALIYILQYLYSTERMMAIKQENLKVFNNSCNCWSTLCPLSKLCVTHPFSINFQCQIENQVSDYRLLGASSLLIYKTRPNDFDLLKQENLKVFNNSCNCWSTLLQNRDHS